MWVAGMFPLNIFLNALDRGSPVAEGRQQDKLVYFHKVDRVAESIFQRSWQLQWLYGDQALVMVFLVKQRKGNETKESISAASVC